MSDEIPFVEIQLSAQQQAQIRRMVINAPGRGSYRSICQSIIDEVLRDDAIEHGENI